MSNWKTWQVVAWILILLVGTVLASIFGMMAIREIVEVMR